MGCSLFFRTATCVAEGNVRCLTLDRQDFVKLIGTSAERHYDEHKLSVSSNGSSELPPAHSHGVTELLSHRCYKFAWIVKFSMKYNQNLWSQFSRSDPTKSHCMSCMNDVRLADLKPIGTLGVGGFGRVELVKCLRAIPAKGQKLPDSYALKVMRKGIKCLTFPSTQFFQTTLSKLHKKNIYLTSAIYCIQEKVLPWWNFYSLIAALFHTAFMLNEYLK